MPQGGGLGRRRVGGEGRQLARQLLLQPPHRLTARIAVCRPQPIEPAHQIAARLAADQRIPFAEQGRQGAAEVRRPEGPGRQQQLRQARMHPQAGHGPATFAQAAAAIDGPQLLQQGLPLLQGRRRWWLQPRELLA